MLPISKPFNLLVFSSWNSGAQFIDIPQSQTQFSSAAAAKSLQSCPTLCNPIDGSPPGSPTPGILQARTLEWVASAVILLPPVFKALAFTLSLTLLSTS